MSSPTLAEMARTAVARARVAGLVTYPRLAQQALATVSVYEDRGALVLRLAPNTRAATHLCERPLGTVRVGPAYCETVTIQGAVRRLDGSDSSGRTLFRLDVGAVRLGGRATQVVDVGSYWAAEPDPLRDCAPAILAHLREGHGDQLNACLRAQGHSQARWAAPRRLDRYGLELAVIEESGVGLARLNFPTPVSRVEDLPPGLSVAMLGQGRCCQRPTSAG